MNYKEITELIKLIGKSNLTEFKVKEGEFELSIRTEKFSKNKPVQMLGPQQPIMPISGAHVPPSYSQAPPASNQESAVPAPAKGGNTDKPKESDTSNYLEVRSPMVGTFYRSSNPEKPPYVKVGDVIEAGSTVCIIEAMKLFNEIESEISGKVVKILLEDAQPVEYDQPLFLVDPKG
ncbi:MAG: acetyl-CoA carboxylase biotin carboxyl carrier protein [Saprospiraceae bacterium]|nr:acetyl-CoA carboxylase biotin carboxyl carrier protein [Saprospiraceae bacterium]